MKTIKRELAHVGMFGQDGTMITRKHLSDCAATFDGDCPLTLGHKLADWMPRFGQVKTVELAKDGSSLVGTVEEQDFLSDAREAGFYPKASVGIKQRAKDGKHYLHHFAYLGAVPPKIRDLKIFSDIGVVYCGDDSVTMFFEDMPPMPPALPEPAAPAAADPADRASAAAKINDAKQRAGWSLQEARSAMDRLFAWAVEMALSGGIPAELQVQAQQLADQFKTPKKSDIDEEGDVELQKDNERLTKELADSQAARLATAKQSLAKAMEGRVPKGKQNLVMALADALGTETIELSDEEGKKEEVSKLDILRRVLEVIPLQVTPGREDLGDGATDGKPVDMSKLMSHV